MYADDTNLTTCHENFNTLINSINSDLNSTRIWLLANRLSVNTTKCEQLFIGSDANLNKISWSPKVYIDDNPVKRVESSKTLGVHIDQKLSWSDHVNVVVKKVSVAIRGLIQVRPYIPTKTALTIYHTMILPLFDYCDIVWDNLPQYQVERLQKLQNRIARIICRRGYETRSADLRQKLNWKTLSERRKEHKAVTIHKIMNGNAPSYLTNSLSTVNEGTSYNLRGKNNLTLPLPRTEYGKRSFLFSGAQVWNSLPSNLKTEKSLNIFKKGISSSLLAS